MAETIRRKFQKLPGVVNVGNVRTRHFAVSCAIFELVVVVTPVLIVRVFQQIARDLFCVCRRNLLDIWLSVPCVAVRIFAFAGVCFETVVTEALPGIVRVAFLQKNSWMECDFRHEKKYLKSFAGSSSNATALTCWLPHETSRFAFHAFVLAKQWEVVWKRLEVIGNELK